MTIRRRAFRSAALAVIVLAAAWVGYLLFSGGSDFTIFGRTISSHEPRRPLLVLAVALTAWILTTRAAGPPARPRPVIRIDDRLVVAAIAMIVLYVGVHYGTKTAGGADSYSYIGQAQSWLRGPLKIPLPWTEPVPWPFAAWTYAPFGYVPSADGAAIVPVVAPGLPLLMAAAARVAGYCAMFWIVPLSGGVLIVSTYLLGRRLGDSRAAMVAAAMVAASPVFLFYLPQPMSDVPTAAAWTTAFALLLSSSVTSAAGAGFVAGLAVLIRPNLAPLVILLPVWLTYKAVRAVEASDRRQRLAQTAAFLIGAAPAVIVLALYNSHVHGAPGQSGYGDPGELFAWSNVGPNLKNYASWFASMETVLPLAGMILLTLPSLARWARVTDPSFTLLLGCFVYLLVAEYLAYKPFDQWYYLRFLLPIFPLLMLGMTLLGRRLQHARPVIRLVVVLVAGGLLVRNLETAVRADAFNVWILESRYVSIARVVTDATEREDLVIAGQFAGAVRHYGGRFTINYNGLEPGWLDRAVGWFQERGVRVYLLADEWELEDVRKRFAGESTLSLLNRPPVVAYAGAAVAQMFDLQQTASMKPTVRMNEIRPLRADCVAPAELPLPVPRPR